MDLHVFPIPTPLPLPSLPDPSGSAVYDFLTFDCSVNKYFLCAFCALGPEVKLITKLLIWWCDRHKIWIMLSLWFIFPKILCTGWVNDIHLFPCGSKNGSVCAQLCLSICDPMACSLPGSSVHETVKARILEQAAISFSRGSSQPRVQIVLSCICCIGRWVLYHSATWEALSMWIPR